MSASIEAIKEVTNPALAQETTKDGTDLEEKETYIKEITAKIQSAVNQLLKVRQHLPAATYRLQFNHLFTFQQATAQIEYLKKLGISDLYASPYLKAQAGSLHGYDIVNHNELN